MSSNHASGLWHRDALWLSNRCMSNDSNELLYSLLVKSLSIDIIRDNIVRWLLPIDVIDLVIATGIFFSEADMARYTNIFKYIIPDRKWLIKKIDEGHTFTIFGTDLSTLRRLGRPQNGDKPSSSSHNSAKITAQVNLIVRKGNRFVRCNNSFAPTSLFATSPTETKNVIDDNALFTEPKSRRIKVTRGCDKLYIWCPSTHISTNRILRLGFRWPWRWRRHCMRQFQVFEARPQEECNIWYAHFSKTGRTVLRRSMNISDEEIQKHVEAQTPIPEAGLFWIAISDDTISRDFRFQIDR